MKIVEILVFKRSQALRLLGSPDITLVMSIYLGGCNPLDQGAAASRIPDNHAPGVESSYFFPTVSNSAFLVSQNSSIEGTLSASFDGNEAISFVVLTPPEKGTLTLDETSGAFSYLPFPEAIGDDQFTFQAKTASGRKSMTATAFIAISAPLISTSAKDITPPEEAVLLSLKNPASSPANVTSPTVDIAVKAEEGQYIRIYNAPTIADCSATNLIGQVSGNTDTVSFVASALTDGHYVFRRHDLRPGRQRLKMFHGLANL